MSAVRIEPTNEVKVPYRTENDTSKTFIEELEVAGNTAEMLVELGAPLELEDSSHLKGLLRAAIDKKDKKALTHKATALAAGVFLRKYGELVAMDVAQVRTAITNKLLEIADCGDRRYELKALELLGKHSDVGLFTERSEVTINHNDPAKLEEAIKQRIKRLLHAEIIEVSPTSFNLDDELDVAPFAQRGGKPKEAVEAEWIDIEEGGIDDEDDGAE